MKPIKKLLMRIEMCCQCPHYKRLLTYDECGPLNQSIDEPDKILAECPLEDFGKGESA